MTIPLFLPLLAALSGPAVLVSPGLFSEYPFLWSVIFLLLIGLNAFLVAAEIALIRVHTSQLEEAVEEGLKGAARALKLQSRVDAYLAACHLGITFSILVIGAMGEPFISGLIYPLFAEADFITEAGVRIFAFFVSVLFLTVFQSILAEQVPRTFGFRRTVRTALWTSAPLQLFYLIVAGPVWLIEKVSRLILRVVFRLEPVDSRQISHTADELRHLVEETGRAQEVTETEQEILRNALELNELCVRDILTPRNDVIVLDVHRTFRENLEIALETKHTRFPLVDGHLDKTLGLIHIKDLLREMQKDSSNLFAAKRDMLRVSELLPLDELLKLFLSKRAHIALVVDEFGGSGGLVMLDDVLDQVVGEIYDEFDEVEEPGFRAVAEGEFIVEGTLPLHELSDHVEELVLDDPDVSTVGGYITSQMGKIPDCGESLAIEGYLVEILSADDRTVQEVKFVKQEVDEDEGGDAQLPGHPEADDSTAGAKKKESGGGLI
ncbi:MAG: hemolysin family protein [Verrucomicrobiales bacterium]|nr:hemolysin family protein [Verrucomicrobiales bacterium]